MSKIINHFICVLMACGLSQVASAQEFTSNTKESRLGESLFPDSTRNQRMEKDLNTRNSRSKNQAVTWKDSGYGYNGTYSKNQVQYMAQYDKNGKYVQTLTKKEWNNDVPAKLRSAYEQSEYKSQVVSGYWQVTDPTGNGYYLELNNDQNNPSQVWVNEDGKFSNSPSPRLWKKNRDMYLVPDSTVKKDH